MATVVYDSLVGDNTQSMNLLASSTLDYPNSNLYNVFGPVYLPRIYGKDLSSFEIASSGKIAITLQDTYAFDLNRDVANLTSFLQTIPGDSFDLRVNNEQVTINMDATSNNMFIAASNTIFMTANKIVYNIAGASTIAAGTDATYSSGGDTYIAATGYASLTSSYDSVGISSAYSNVFVRLDHSTCNLLEYARNDMQFSASNNYIVNAASNVRIDAQMTDLTLNAASSNVHMFMTQSDKSLSTWSASNTLQEAGSNMTMTASNNMYLKSLENMHISGADGGVSYNMNTDTSVDALAKTYRFNSTSNLGYGFDIQGTNMVTIQHDKVIINGGMDIFGVVNSISVTNTELHINDKTVQLSYPIDDQVIVDGTNNTASGMVVNGLPSSASNLDATLAGKIYNKSFQWNYGSTGIDGMMTNSGINTESFWELQGGRFQLSSTKSDGKAIAFALRINEQDELEMVKFWDDATNTKQVRRIAKFGRTLM